MIFGIQILWLPIDGIIVLPTNIGQLLTVVVVVVIINAVNFIDGLDGLATGIVGISAAAFFGFSYLLAVENAEDKLKMTKFAWETAGIKAVRNDIVIADETSFKQRAKDILISAQLEAALLINKKINSRNYNLYHFHPDILSDA